MERRWGWVVAAGAIMLMGAVLLQGQVGLAPKVSKVTVTFVTPAPASESLIRSHIRVKVGDDFSQSAVDDDIRNLYGTGFFEQVVVEPKRTADGVELEYRLYGKLRLTVIKFTGNKKFSDAKLMRKLSSKVGEPLDSRKLFTDEQELLKMYQKAGLHRTTVKAIPSPDEKSGKATVTFEINESPKVKIARVEFVGAQAFPEKKLRKVIKTRPRKFFSFFTTSGRLKDDVLDDDKEKLADFYRNEGYVDFDLKEVKVDSLGPKAVVVRFIFTEGRLYRVGSIGFKGNTIYSSNELAKVLKMTQGQVFRPKNLQADVEALDDKYGEKGYIDTRVFPIKAPNVEKGTIDLVYDIEEGEQAYIEKIEIRGNVKTKDKVIRRELTVAPGEVFDMVRVKKSKARLEGLNYFEKVETRSEPAEPGQERGNRKNLIVNVQEKSTGNIAVGAGFSSLDALIGYVEFTQGNFDITKFKPPLFQGGGQKLRLRAQVGTVSQDYLISFIEPWFLQRKLELQVDLFHQRLDYVSVKDIFDERRTGARLSLTRALFGNENLKGTVAYTIENVGIVNVADWASQEIKLESGYRLVSKVGTGLSYDTRNHPTLPTKGFRTSLYGEVAGGPFMGDTDYYRIELSHAHYIKGFAEGHLWELSARIGSVSAYGNSTRVPLFDRYFLGGPYTLRGFDYRDVAPHDNTGESIGGNTMWFGSVEYSVPVIEMLRVAAFYDIGNVYSSSFSFSRRTAYGVPQKPFYDDIGLGLRLRLPIGPFRIDFGYPLHHDQFNKSSGKFQFGVGYTREF